MRRNWEEATMERKPKVKRNYRIVYMSHYLSERPNQLIQLSYFTDYFDCAKSSVSEDLDYIRQVFSENGLGTIKTLSGVAGGVVYQPALPDSVKKATIQDLIFQLKQGKRILPGNYIYLTDILQQQNLIYPIAKMIAQANQDKEIDAVVTIETKGIGLAAAVAYYLNVDYMTVRRDSQDTEGSTISVNYVSGTHRNVKKMELSKNSLKPASKVLIVDDFMRNGGTIEGLISLVEEFECETVSICVLVDNTPDQIINLPNYQSIIKVAIVYNQTSQQFELSVNKGNFFE